MVKILGSYRQLSFISLSLNRGCRITKSHKLNTINIRKAKMMSSVNTVQSDTLHGLQIKLKGKGLGNYFPLPQLAWGKD